MYFASFPKKYQSLALVLLLTIVCVAPFLNKPFHIDDPFFVWTSQQIQKDPFNPYGFQKNWFGTEQWMYQIAKAPPLFSYLLAMWGIIFGLGEIGCHLFNLLVALTAVTGIYFLAEEFSCDPFLVTVISVSSPLFVLSSSVVMCDLLMLTFWIWSFLVWIKAVRGKSQVEFLISSLLASACVLTKYNGVLLLPLMFLAAFLPRRRFTRSLFWLVLPCIVLLAYYGCVTLLYDDPLITGTVEYILANKKAGLFPIVNSLLTGVVFAGGAVGGGLPFSFFPLRKREITWLISAALAATLIAVTMSIAPSVAWLAQYMFWIFGGLALAWLAVREAIYPKDAQSIVLAAWLGVTIFFSAVINWDVNGRSLITLIPAVGLLLARTLPWSHTLSRGRVLFLASPMLLCSVLIGWADYESAYNNKKIVQRLISEFKQENHGDRTLWFEGHWGFQYYMEMLGGHALDIQNSEIRPGDPLILPINNSNIYLPKQKDVLFMKKFDITSILPLAVMNKTAGAGYYSSNWGRLPFVFGAHSVEDVYVLFLRKVVRGIAA